MVGRLSALSLILSSFPLTDSAELHFVFPLRPFSLLPPPLPLLPAVMRRKRAFMESLRVDPREQLRWFPWLVSISFSFLSSLSLSLSFSYSCSTFSFSCSLSVFPLALFFLPYVVKETILSLFMPCPSTCTRVLIYAFVFWTLPISEVTRVFHCWIINKHRLLSLLESHAQLYPYLSTKNFGVFTCWFIS
jgi:hypothetical protein